MNKAKYIIGYLVFFELISLNAYTNPIIGSIAFFAIFAAVLLLSTIDLKYGIWAILAELFVGSKGYLFSHDFGGATLSIRITLWLAVMSVWLAKLSLAYFSGRDKEPGKKSFADMSAFFRSEFYMPFMVLFIFIGWGIASGLMSRNGLGNVFFDMNGWIYYFAIFPAYAATRTGKDLKFIWSLMLASVIWLSAKTYIILFIFSHYNPEILGIFYGWVRDTGVGEITKMEGSFYRVFFQSHIYLVIGLFYIVKSSFQDPIPKRISELAGNRIFRTNFLISSFVAGALLVSLSRSFWIGLLVGVIAYFILLFKEAGYKKIYPQAVLIGSSFLVGFMFVSAVAKFPYPQPIEGFNTASLLIDRASEFSGEAAVSSRWSQLPELRRAIAEEPILGKGFGASVTYKSSDPRVLSQNPDGNYTTFAFEWGWLDIWLKLGFFGFLAYLFLVAMLIFKGIAYMPKDVCLSKFCRIASICLSGLSRWFPSLSRLTEKFRNNSSKIMITISVVGLIVLSAVNFFTPYLNHPLGIGFIIVAALTIEGLKDDKEA